MGRAALGKSLEAAMVVKAAKIAQGLSWTGIVRLYVAVLGSDAPNAPRRALKISNAFASKSLGPVLSEWEAIPATFDAVRQSNCAVKGKGDKLDRVWLELQNDIASWSVRSSIKLCATPATTFSSIAPTRSWLQFWRW